MGRMNHRCQEDLLMGLGGPCPEVTFHEVLKSYRNMETSSRPEKQCHGVPSPDREHTAGV